MTSKYPDWMSLPLLFWLNVDLKEFLRDVGILLMDCNFYEGRLCIMMEEEERPCERCDIVSMWWVEKDKQLALRDAEEIATPLERKMNELQRIQTIDA